MYNISEQRMSRRCKHDIIRYTHRLCQREQCRNLLVSEHIDMCATSDIQIQIYTSVVVENEVTGGVHSLYAVWIGGEGLQEPRILLSDEIQDFFISPI